MRSEPRSRRLRRPDAARDGTGVGRSGTASRPGAGATGQGYPRVQDVDDHRDDDGGRHELTCGQAVARPRWRATRPAGAGRHHGEDDTGPERSARHTDAMRYPAQEPFDSGVLETADGHAVFWERVG